MWLHSSPLGFDIGAELLPPSVTGRRPRTFAEGEDYGQYDWYRDDRVYVWPYGGDDPLEVLDAFAWSSSASFLYEVEPVDVGHDGDLIAGPLGSQTCRSAVVLRCLFDPTTDTLMPRWIRLDVNTVPPDPSYRDETREWAARVNWALVNQRALELFDLGEFDDLGKVDEAARDLCDDDRWGLYSLRMEPVGGTPEGVINGIHRMEAMRAQRVRFTVALK